MREWVDRHVGLPEPIARTIIGAVITSLRGYFRGVTFVAAFNGVVVGLAALILDVPLAGTIAVVTFVTAYVPYIGAVVAGTFAVLLALGAQGPGSRSRCSSSSSSPTACCRTSSSRSRWAPRSISTRSSCSSSTIGAGCLFGMLGLVLAAPLVSAAVRVAKELNRPPEQAAEPRRHRPKPRKATRSSERDDAPAAEAAIVAASASSPPPPRSSRGTRADADPGQRPRRSRRR